MELFKSELEKTFIKLTKDDVDSISSAFALLEDSLIQDKSKSINYIPPLVDECFQCYFTAIREIREIYNSNSWISLAVCELYPIFMTKTGNDRYINLDNMSLNYLEENFTHILWVYLLSVLYQLAGLSLLERLKRELEIYNIQYKDSDFERFNDRGVSYPHLMKEYIDSLFLYSTIQGETRNFRTSFNFFDICRDITPDAYFLNNNQRELLRKFPWQHDSNVLNHILGISSSLEEYGGMDVTILRPIIDYITEQAKKYRLC